MSKDVTLHISRVIDYLNVNAEYAVLRNYEGLPDNNESRDIDIIITRASLKKVLRPIAELIDKSGWKILTYLNSDRLYTYVCAKDFGDRTEVVQWDFFINTSAFGIELMSAEEFLKYRQFNGFLYYVGIEVQFLDKYLYNRCVGAQYPQKYHATREAAEFSSIVENKIAALYGCKSVVACDKANSKKLILHAIGYNLKKRPIAFVIDVLAFLYTFVRNYVMSRTGFSIGFTGPDGSGKTTVIDLMIERLGEVFRKAHAYYHFRPSLYGNISDVAHSAGLKKEVDKNYSDPHRGGKTGVLSSLARLGYYAVDYLLGYFVKVKSVTRITRLVIFDRYYTDIICDSRRTRVYLPYKFLYWFGRVFIPSLDYNILLTAKSETILARKKELDEPGIRSINEKIDYLSDKPGYYKVLNEGTADEAVTKILEIVFEKQHRKNLKRIWTPT